jgi:DNA polymerase-1
MIHFVAPYRVGEYPQATLQDVINHANSCKKIGLDTETTGLDPLMDSIIMLQIGDETHQFVIDVRYTDLYPLKDILENPRIVKVMVNAKFDYEFFVQQSIRLENVKDCFLQEKILLGGRPDKASLEAMSRKYTAFHYTQQLSLFEETLSKDIRKEFTTLQNQEFSTSHILYGAYDVILPLMIDKKQMLALNEANMEFCAELENEYSCVLGDIETNGFFCNPQKWDIIGQKVSIELDETLQRINKWLIDNGYGHYEGINWNSSKQVSKLFKEIGIPIGIIDKEKSKNTSEPVFKDSVQRANIEKFSKNFEIVTLYLTLKKFEKSSNTYGKKFLSNIHLRTGRIHSKYNQILNTGRMSSTSPNLQNIKRDSDYRQCFGPANPNNVLVVADYAAQESRIMADMANEKNMIEFFESKGGDIHSFTATKMFKVEVTPEINPELRFKAKTLNFGIPYGMSEFKLAKDFSVPVDEARDVISSWFNAYPDLAHHFQKVKQFVRENGFIVIDPITNRRYYPSDYTKYVYYKDLIDYYKRRNYEIPRFFWSSYYSSLGKIEREAQNYPIQGTGASMTKYAAILFRRWIRDNNLWNKVWLVNIVHDEVVIECDRNFSTEVSEQIKFCMEEAGRLFCKKVPMVVTPVITEAWKH